MKRITRNEQGAALVFVALLMVGLLTITAIVIDGGQAYADHRQMQNAADSASLAGTRVLGLKKFKASGSDILVKVRDVAAKNGSDPVASADCRLIDLTNGVQTELSGCSNAEIALGAGGFAATLAKADGVLVNARQTRQTMFGRVAGQASITAGGTAAATLQGVRLAPGPWMVCGSLSIGGYDMLNAVGDINELKSRQLYGGPPTDPVGTDLPDPRGIPIHGKVDKACGLSSNWKGLVDPDELVPPKGPPELGDYVDHENGKKVGQYMYDDVLAGTDGCPPSISHVDNATDDFGPQFDNCLVAIPLFDDVKGPNARLAQVAVFRLHYDQQGNVKYYGQFVCAQSCGAINIPTSEDNTGGLNAVKLVR